MSQEQRDEVDRLLRAAAFDTGLPAAELRAMFTAHTATERIDPDVIVTPTTLAGLPALRFTPRDPVDGVILYFHGGAHVFGSPATAAGLTASLGRRARVPAISVDYRLAPEHPFPADVDDALAAYRALLEGGTPAEDVVVAGDSAGGHLTIATLLGARDAGLPPPAGAVAFSPGLDVTGSGTSMTTKEGIDPLFSRALLAPLRAQYLGDADPRQPRLSPAICGDLGGLPPILVQVGTHDVLLDDSVRFAARAAAADADVLLDVTAGVPHVFQTFHGLLDEADDALDRAAAHVGKVLRRRAVATRTTA